MKFLTSVRLSQEEEEEEKVEEEVVVREKGSFFFLCLIERNHMTTNKTDAFYMYIPFLVE